ncbi:PQQ-dependent sugar dehydrogenase [Epibacterium sp. SM1969]|uniref:PQQ-dependent sugar dehydrogenase n=1 Tax=Tritonibacter aquimaris TaxID=2663379 RepID=A0A844AWA2_9RHOB|nr:PQQ-dependent sugar dehydrogenase [Tritonibacter aquimaris]MQY41476.1 PQQ-dependent sugar dehydrogenase [Tritonibacter aquimaris]
MFRRVYGSIFAAALAGFATLAGAETLQTSAGPVELTKMAEGLDVPWGFDFLPDQSVLITDRGGRLYHLKDQKLSKIKGVPKVAEVGQGGLLDILVPRDFATQREILLTLSRATKGGAGTAVVAAKLSADFSTIESAQLLLQVRGAKGGRHFGSRIVEAKDGSLFVTSGERGDRPSAQNNRNLQGTILRIHRDGSPHRSAPFANMPDARDEIWSFGHRNPQGLALDAQGRLWAVEHGARGGDEINRIHKGANYGWPVIAYGRHYSGAQIGEGQAKDGMEQPAFYWDPSIAPSGLMIYSGTLWPEWKGDFFVGSLKFDYIARLDGAPMQEREQIRHDRTGRIRDIREAPDGSIWFASQSEGALFRISPAN